MILLVAGGAFAVLLMFSLVASAGVPAACGACHAMAPYASALSSGPHGTVGCATCHAPSLATGVDMGRRVLFTMVPAALSGSALSGPGQDVPSEGCHGCHDESIEQVVDRAGKLMQHSTCAVDEPCVACHGTVAHGDIARVVRSYSMESCADCHRGAGASIACDACHSPHTQNERLSRGAWQVTHGAEWDKTHGLGSLTSCGVCHAVDYCVRCHGTQLPHSVGFAQTHGDEAKANLTVCYSCHDPAALCTPCHGIEMPHPDGFLKAHTELASGVEDPECVHCHEPDECVACHVRHVHPGGATPLTGPGAQ